VAAERYESKYRDQSGLRECLTLSYRAALGGIGGAHINSGIHLPSQSGQIAQSRPNVRLPALFASRKSNSAAKAGPNQNREAIH
jgi:hypothetical protein